MPVTLHWDMSPVDAGTFSGFAVALRNMSESLNNLGAEIAVNMGRNRISRKNLTGVPGSGNFVLVGDVPTKTADRKDPEMPRRRNRQMCECGCGNLTETGRFLRGHATRLRWQLIKAAEAESGTALPTATGSVTYLDREQVKNELNSRRWTIPANRRAFGVEFELISPVHSSELYELLTRAKIKVLNFSQYRHSANRTHWEIKTDGSLRANRAGDRGYEIVSPILRGKRGENEVRKVLKVLNDAGCRVNASTGTHVHVQAVDLNVEGVKNVALTYNNAGHALDLLFAPSRRGIRNQYCQPLNRVEVEELRNATRLNQIRGNKYRKINVTTYPRLGTLEFRQHQGTLNADKILSWVKFAKGLVQTGGKVADLPTVTVDPNAETTLRNLFTVVKLDNESTRLLMNRYYANRAA